MVKKILPSTTAPSIAPFRPVLMQTLRNAVDSGDVKTSKYLFSVMTGKRLADKVGPRDTLGYVEGWLSRQIH